MSHEKLVVHILALVAIFPSHNYGYEDSSPSDLVAGVFLDNGYGDTFLAELLASKFIMTNGRKIIS